MHVHIERWGVIVHCDFSVAGEGKEIKQYLEMSTNKTCACTVS